MFFKRFDVAQFPDLEDFSILAGEFRGSHPGHCLASGWISKEISSVFSSKTQSTKGLVGLNDHGMYFAVIIRQGFADGGDHTGKAFVANAIHTNVSIEAKRGVTNLGDQFNFASIPNIGNELFDEFSGNVNGRQGFVSNCNIMYLCRLFGNITSRT